MLHTWKNPTKTPAADEIAQFTFDPARLSIDDYMNLKWSQHVLNQANADPAFAKEHFVSACDAIAKCATAAKAGNGESIGDVAEALQKLNWTTWAQMNNFFTGELQKASSGAAT